MSESTNKPIADPKPDAAHPDWFREPNAKELKIGIGLFIGFGIFFFLSFKLGRDWGFRWVLLGLGIISTIRGLWYLVCLIRLKDKQKNSKIR